MGRRAPRKIDPALDLSRHWKEADELLGGAEPAALFGRSSPLEIEVGSGKGLFLVNASTARPEHDFLGIEISRKFARLAAARLARAQRPNAVVVHGDARQLFQQWLPPASAVAIHVYFPDPWWKKRHKKRRVMTPAFIEQIERVLQTGGRLHFWTDVEEYFQTTLELITGTSPLTGPLAVGEPSADDQNYRTHFERRMRLHGEAVYRAEFQK